MKNSFTITKFIKAKRSRVFEAWINPDLMRQWDCPEHCDPVSVEQDMTPGGSYRNTMIDRESGEEVTVFGRCLELIPGTKLKFTSQWEGSNEPGFSPHQYLLR